MIGRLIRGITLIVFFVLVACTPKMGEDDVVAVDNRVFDRNQFFADVVESKFVNLDPDHRQKVVDEFARRQIVSLEAERRDLMEDVATEKAEARMRGDLIVDKLLEEEVWARLVSDSSLKLLYDRMGRRINVHHIVVTFKDSRHSKSDRSEINALQVIREIRDRIMKGR